VGLPFGRRWSLAMDQVRYIPIHQWALIIEGPGDVTRIRHTRESLPLFHLQLAWYLAPTEAQRN